MLPTKCSRRRRWHVNQAHIAHDQTTTLTVCLVLSVFYLVLFASIIFVDLQFKWRKRFRCVGGSHWGISSIVDWLHGSLSAATIQKAFTFNLNIRFSVRSHQYPFGYQFAKLPLLHFDLTVGTFFISNFLCWMFYIKWGHCTCIGVTSSVVQRLPLSAIDRTLTSLVWVHHCAIQSDALLSTRQYSWFYYLSYSIYLLVKWNSYSIEFETNCFFLILC